MLTLPSAESNRSAPLRSVLCDQWPALEGAGIDCDCPPDVSYRGGFTDEHEDAALQGGCGGGTVGSVDAITGELIAILAVGATLLGVMVVLFGWMRGDMGRIGDKLDRFGERLSAVEGRLSVIETILHAGPAR